MASDSIHYILNPAYTLRGWKLLPYAVQNRFTATTEFLMKPRFDLICACDGKADIHPDELTEEERRYYDHILNAGIIRRAKEGEHLKPEQEYHFYPARFKEHVQWSITGRCNFRCRHCFMSAPHAAQGEPSWDQLMHMLDAFERCGVKAVSLTGGEPLIRPDFFDLVDAVRERKIVIRTIYSNGMLVTDEFLDKLTARRIWPSFQFSYDGVGYHDWMRGIPNAEQMVIDALKRCRERGFPTSLSMVLFKENKDSIRDTVNQAAQLGCYAIKVGNASPQGEWADQKEHYLTQGEAYEAYLDYIPRFFEDGKPITLGLEGFFNYDKGKDEIGAFQEKNIREELFPKAQMCGHVRREMYISPKGNVLPCMSMVGGPIEDQFPNMLDTPLEEILDSRSLYMDMIDFRISDFMEHNPECQECEYKTACCGGCRAIAVRDHPTEYLSRDLQTCHYFKDGWKAKKDALLSELGILK